MVIEFVVNIRLIRYIREQAASMNEYRNVDGSADNMKMRNSPCYPCRNINVEAKNVKGCCSADEVTSPKSNQLGRDNLNPSTLVSGHADILASDSKRSIEVGKRSNKGVPRNEYEARATKTVIVISFVQIVTTLPLVASFLKNIYLLASDQHIESIDQFYYTRNWLRIPVILNSISNALVFVYRSRKIMDVYKKLFRRVFSIS